MLRVNNEKYDVIHENFDGYFEQRATKLTEQQKSLLPRKLMVKLYKRGGKITNNLNTSKLNFLEKLYVLFKMFKSRWYIVVEDENGGGFDEWNIFKKAIKKNELSQGNIERTVNEGHFFLANKEVCDAFSYINELCVSPSYNYLIGAKNSKGIAQWRKERRYIAKFIENYESQKKRFLINYNLQLAEWYILVSLYNDVQMLSSQLYKDVFKYSFGASHIQFKRAMISLQDKKMVVKYGNTRGSTIKITPTGSDMVNQIVSKYIVNC